MDFQKEVEVKGIPAYRFTPPRSVLASKEENPDNAGFCVSPKECLGTGLLKVSPCRKGNHRLAPACFPQPRFCPSLFSCPLSCTDKHSTYTRSLERSHIMKESLHFSFLFLPLYLCHVLSEMGKVHPLSFIWKQALCDVTKGADDNSRAAACYD